MRIVLPGTDPQIAIVASKSLGRLALAGGTLTSEFVEFEVKRALEWLQGVCSVDSKILQIFTFLYFLNYSGDRNEQRRFAAVLILREFAQNAPTLIYGYVPQILELIWVALRDPKVTIRDSGADALGACLELVHVRESNLRVQWYRKMYEESNKGLKLGSTEGIHSYFLIIKEMLEKTENFLDSKYRDIAETVMRYRDYKEPLIRKAVILLFPVLAHYDPKTYGVDYLQSSMIFVLGGLKREKDRGPCA